MHYVKYNDFFMLKLYLLFFGFTNVFFFSQITAKVVGIKDGDTIVILEDGNKTKTLRLAEVDCPESGQPFGKNAKKFTSDCVFGKMIKYYEINYDRYGRTIAKVYFDDKYLSAEIIANGLGWWYEKYSKDYSLKKLQDNAKYNKIGLWQDKNAISPYEWRQINKVNF